MEHRIYTVNQLAKLAGVSVRTLHHYDQIGLLTPPARAANGYRLYRSVDLLRLQQILFFKELDFPLGQIKQILDRPDFDQVQALRDHRRRLQERSDQIGVLLKTIDKTIQKLTEVEMELTDAELYEGFTQEQIDRYKKEVAERYDPALVAESNRRVSKMSKAQWAAIKQEGGEISLRMAELIDREPGDPEVQQVVVRHYAWINNFYTPPPEVYRGLGQLYTDHPEFRANYEKIKPGLADFMRAAMEYYCDHTLAA